MKNGIIVLLIVAVLGLGGWMIYDKNKSSDTVKTTSSSNTSSTQKEPLPKDENTLDFNNQGLTSVGPEIYNKTNTTILILSNNNISTLPTEMGNMKKLEVLKLDHNGLEGSLIGEVRQMPLKTLDVSYNKMTGVPAEIGQLNKLETLNYSYNNITGLPNELSKLKNNLKEFNLTGNPLSQDTINKIKASLPNTTIIF